MEKHECIIGEWIGYDHTELVTFEELISNVKINNDSSLISFYCHLKLAQPLKLSDYFDRRKSRNLNHFNYCPYCGEKIDWKQLKIGAAAK